MRRLLAVTACLAALTLAPAPAWAESTTDIVQGAVLRLVSVADWATASDMNPGDALPWDVTVSAAAEPGTVTIALSATGDAPVRIDALLCASAWKREGCPGPTTTLRSGWTIPSDGEQVTLWTMPDTDVAHLRLVVALESGGSAQVRIHAHGAGDSIVAAPEGGLALTGPSGDPRPMLVAGTVLCGAGVMMAARRRRSPVHRRWRR